MANSLITSRIGLPLNPPEGQALDSIFVDKLISAAQESASDILHELYPIVSTSPARTLDGNHYPSCIEPLMNEGQDAARERDWNLFIATMHEAIAACIRNNQEIPTEVYLRIAKGHIYTEDFSGAVIYGRLAETAARKNGGGHQLEEALSLIASGLLEPVLTTGIREPSKRYLGKDVWPILENALEQTDPILEGSDPELIPALRTRNYTVVLAVFVLILLGKTENAGKILSEYWTRPGFQEELHVQLGTVTVQAIRTHLTSSLLELGRLPFAPRPVQSAIPQPSSQPSISARPESALEVGRWRRHGSLAAGVRLVAVLLLAAAFGVGVAFATQFVKKEPAAVTSGGADSPAARSTIHRAPIADLVQLTVPGRLTGSLLSGRQDALKPPIHTTGPQAVISGITTFGARELKPPIYSPFGKAEGVPDGGLRFC